MLNVTVALDTGLTCAPTEKRPLILKRSALNLLRRRQGH